MSTAVKCNRCLGALDSAGVCVRCGPESPEPNKTVMVQVSAGAGGAAPLAAGDDLGRIPLPDGWEITLDIIEGPDRGTTHRVARSRVLICRGGGDISLSDQRASRKHASLEVYGSTCVLLKDLGSTNGTYLNGRRVNAAELTDGDEIRVGDTKLVIGIGAPPT